MRLPDAVHVFVHAGRRVELARRLACDQRAYELELAQAFVERGTPASAEAAALVEQTRATLDRMQRHELTEICRWRQPPRNFRMVVVPLVALLDDRTCRGDAHEEGRAWEALRMHLASPRDLLVQLRGMDEVLNRTRAETIMSVRALVESHVFEDNLNILPRISRGCAVLGQWLAAMMKLVALREAEEEAATHLAARVDERRERLEAFRAAWTRENVPHESGVIEE